MGLEKKIVYFEKGGIENTEETLRLVKERGEELGIKDILLSSTTGYSAKKALEILGTDKFRLIVVTHCYGFKEKGKQEMDEETRRFLLENKVIVHTSTHAFGGIGRAVRRSFKTFQFDELLGYAFRKVVSEGFKVALEITMMACDAGLIGAELDVIACGGTSRGIDTALVIVPSHSFDLFSLRVKEIICKPY